MLTPREYWNLYGTLPADMVEALLDTNDKVGALLNAKAYAKEAQIDIGEDFLGSVISDAQSLKKSLRGVNRESAEALADKLESLQCELSQAVDYANEQIHSVLLELDNDY